MSIDETILIELLERFIVTQERIAEEFAKITKQEDRAYDLLYENYKISKEIVERDNVWRAENIQRDDERLAWERKPWVEKLGKGSEING